MRCGAFSLLGFLPVCETHPHECFKLHPQKVNSSAASVGSGSSVYSQSFSLLLSGGRTLGPVGLSWHLPTFTDGTPSNKLEISWTALTFTPPCQKYLQPFCVKAGNEHPASASAQVLLVTGKRKAGEGTWC